MLRKHFWAVIVAQLAEWLLPTPEVRGSNPVIGKMYIGHCLLSTVLKRQKCRKRGREWTILNIIGTEQDKILYFDTFY